MPAAARLKVEVRDAINGHWFFGGPMQSVEPPLFRTHGHDTYTNCGDAGSGSDAEEAGGYPASYVRARDRADRHQRLHERR